MPESVLPPPVGTVSEKRPGASFAASPEHLGILTFARAVVQALASPLAGVLGHYVNRTHVITAGAALWGAMCLCFAFTRSIAQVRLAPFVRGGQV